MYIYPYWPNYYPWYPQPAYCPCCGRPFIEFPQITWETNNATGEIQYSCTIPVFKPEEKISDGDQS